MPRKNKKKTLRIKNLIMVCTLSAIVLTVSTYAWFIGMRTVNVSSFDVEIASTNSLLLSLDGEKWSQSVEINGENYNDVANGIVYAGNTNSWGTGLVPVSSVGKIDTVASRLVLYEKASLTATPGGYRLMASRVNNFNKDGEGKLESEFNGYIAFDLFVKNFTGTQYLENYNVLDEEAIYLTNDSEVNVAETGIKNTGIENSVRIAFAQIGRVAGTTTDAAKITGITCNASGEENEPSIVGGVTGICRTAQIWEPNDKDHVANAISWYNNSCLKRTGEDITVAGSYGENANVACKKIINGISYPTYAINNAIGSDNNVDIYDGAAYNGYETSQTNELLYAFPYFKDTDKLLTGTERPEFMRLAPNSITKIRVYIWIEGQDIDNYDFAAIGKKISVSFGFTKERYTEDDIGYEGEDLNQGEGPNGSDLTAPIITLNGDAIVTHIKGTEYVDEGATAEDNIDETVTVETFGTVNKDEVGTYYITYKAKDTVGNLGTKTRIVNVVEE